MAILDDILATKRDEVTVLHQPATRERITRAALAAPPVRDFGRALRRDDGHLAVIAEIKRKSPSKGALAPDLDPEQTARVYEAGGAAALSVLTDGPFFGGTIGDLQIAHEMTGLPVLRKDFVIDQVQVFESRGVGADAVLLIVAALPIDGQLADLHALALDLGLAALVEAHDEREVERALAVGARIVGVNSRSLETFAEDLAIAERLAALLPPEVVRVAESAVRSVDDAQRMAAVGFDAVLVGEALVRSTDPAGLVGAMAGVRVAPGRRSP
ncbi:MAG: indole-3-glycerol phosphate synthase [Actinomycetota bacterium]|jgi:indole-3-glycerol phosphate synthase|nr:indole-3-glycerol phosphate synthase [Actinomycetota bacterium]